MRTLNSQAGFAGDTSRGHKGDDMDRQNILELEANGAATPLATVRAWNALALGTIGTVALAHEPAHALALVHTCMYNAWAAYDDNARQTAHGVAFGPRQAHGHAMRG
ncbi:hypothetical protein, partial [Massilia sp. CT11-108]|uniref:hypothetical protein n=1 Tax=Massilia sp. CT11-108 TaxID=3393900 RepID=UPI0039A566AB